MHVKMVTLFRGKNAYLVIDTQSRQLSTVNNQSSNIYTNYEEDNECKWSGKLT